MTKSLKKERIQRSPKPVATIAPIKVPLDLAEALFHEKIQHGWTWSELLEHLWEAYKQKR